MPSCYAEKVAGDGRRSGKPDIDACLRGRALKLEAKRPKIGKPTKLQLANLDRWRKAGAVAEIVTSVDDVKQILEREGLL